MDPLSSEALQGKRYIPSVTGNARGVTPSEEGFKEAGKLEEM
jgi:hypothetical protein